MLWFYAALCSALTLGLFALIIIGMCALADKYGEDAVKIVGAGFLFFVLISALWYQALSAYVNHPEVRKPAEATEQR